MHDNSGFVHGNIGDSHVDEINSNMDASHLADSYMAYALCPKPLSEGVSNTCNDTVNQKQTPEVSPNPSRLSLDAHGEIHDPLDNVPNSLEDDSSGAWQQHSSTHAELDLCDVRRKNN